MADVIGSSAPVAGILLAAGRARRMGSSKVLLPWFERPLVRHLAEVALASNLAELIVVVGNQAEAVEAALLDLPLRIIHNPAYAEGQSTSLRAGLAALGAEYTGVLVMLADQPLLTTDTIDALLRAFYETNAPIVAACAAGQRGNPVLFARELVPELMQISGDQGARSVIAAHKEELHCVEVDPAVFTDLDTPEEYAALRQTAGKE